MGIALIKLRIMPVSPDTDLQEIKVHAEAVLKKKNARGISFEEMPIAFGLKAVIASFNIDESEELEIIESAIAGIKNVQSVHVDDMRRAIG